MISWIVMLAWFALVLFCWLCLLNREGRITAQNAELTYWRATAANALAYADDAMRQGEHRDKMAGAYLREAACLANELEYLKGLQRGDSWLDADDVIAQAEAIVAGVTP